MDLEQKAIARIKAASEMSLHYYEKPLICTYSGGKDSDVMLELFKRSGVPFEVCNSHTSADAPPTVYHIRDVFRELELQGIKCTIDYHTQPDGSRITMWNLIPQKMMPPTRLARYCCDALKESGNKNSMIATGIRWDESIKRSNREPFETIGSKKSRVRVSDEKMLLTDNDDARRLFERCEVKAKTIVNPIIDWKNCDIWEFINAEKIHTNPLYQQGFDRVGCIGCPMAGKKRWFEFSVFPKYKDMYINAFKQMLEVRKAKGKDDSTGKWKDEQSVFRWWMEDDNIDGQLSIEDILGDVR